MGRLLLYEGAEINFGQFDRFAELLKQLGPALDQRQDAGGFL